MNSQRESDSPSEHRDGSSGDRQQSTSSGEPATREDQERADQPSTPGVGGQGLYGADADPPTLRAAVTGGDVPVAVYGLGKMGLPLATVFASITGNTIGVDIDQDVVDEINAGRCPVDGEPGLAAMVDRTVGDSSFVAVTNGERAARRARVHVIIVPTLVEDGQPDLSRLQAATATVAAGLAPGDLVCVESTVPPGTCRDVLAPLLFDESDCAAGEFGLAFCPERTASGRALRDIGGAYPKIVGGIDPESTRAARLLYEQVTENDVLAVSDATTAESVKVFEGVYRDVNIALANELATYADELGIDVREAIAIANTQPYCDIHSPGPGVGGHCIPYYPYFLIEGLETASPLLRMARQINDSMPAYTVREVIAGLHEIDVPLQDAMVGVLGIAYRPGVAETRESPGLAIASLLEEVGIGVQAMDPIVDVREHGLEPLTAVDGDALDAVVLVTDCEEFQSIPWNDLDQLVIVDGRDALDVSNSKHYVSTIGVASE